MSWATAPWGTSAWGGSAATAEQTIVPGAQVIVANVDYSPMLAMPQGVTVECSLGDRSTASFRLIDATRNVRFLTGEPVQIRIDGRLVFGGMVDSVKERVPLGTGHMFVDVECVDWTALCDRHVVVHDFNVEGQTLRDIVVAITTLYSGDAGETLADDGVVIVEDSVEVGPVIGRVKFNYDTVKEAFDALAELTGFWWTIDASRVLRFVDRVNFRAATPIDPNVFQGHGEIAVSRDRGEYRNIQYLRGGYGTTAKYSETDVFAGDGETQSFVLRLPVDAIKVNGSGVTVVEVNRGIGYVEEEVGNRSTDEDLPWYYEVGSDKITQGTGDKLTETDKLRVVYSGRFPILDRGKSTTEIKARAAIEGTSGVEVAVEEDQKLNDESLAAEKIQSLLRRYGRVPTTVKLTMYHPLYECGHIVEVNQADHRIGTDFLVDGVTISFAGYRGDGQQTEVYAYEVSAVEGEFIGGWSDFFRRQSKRGRPFVLNENEKIQLLFYQEDILGVGTVVSMEEPLGSFLQDKYSRIIVGGRFVGGIRSVSVEDESPGYYYGPRIGLPKYAEVS